MDSREPISAITTIGKVEIDEATAISSQLLPSARACFPILCLIIQRGLVAFLSIPLSS